MYIIIDANVAAKAFALPFSADYVPIWRWIQEGGGRLVYGGRLFDELRRVQKVRSYLAELKRAGLALTVEREPIDQKQREIEKSGLCTSNDLHVIALALVSGTRTLCTEDADLEQDFKNPALISHPRGSIYKNAGHAHLLRHSSGCMGRN